MRGLVCGSGLLTAALALTDEQQQAITPYLASVHRN